MSVNLEPAERYNIVVYEEEFPNSIEVSEQGNMSLHNIPNLTRNTFEDLNLIFLEN